MSVARDTLYHGVTPTAIVKAAFIKANELEPAMDSGRGLAAEPGAATNMALNPSPSGGRHATRPYS